MALEFECIQCGRKFRELPNPNQLQSIIEHILEHLGREAKISEIEDWIVVRRL